MSSSSLPHLVIKLGRWADPFRGSQGPCLCPVEVGGLACSLYTCRNSASVSKPAFRLLLHPREKLPPETVEGQSSQLLWTHSCEEASTTLSSLCARLFLCQLGYMQDMFPCRGNTSRAGSACLTSQPVRGLRHDMHAKHCSRQLTT